MVDWRPGRLEPADWFDVGLEDTNTVSPGNIDQ